MTTFSIVVPTHNRLALLQRAIQSVERQTFTDFELIVIDDGSSDGTANWLATLTDPRIRPIRHDHPRGASAARNAGLRAAQGGLIAFLYDDDEYRPQFLAQHQQQFAADANLAWAWTGICRYFWSDDGKIREADQVWNTADSQRRYLTQLATSYGLVARKRVLDEVGLFDETMPVAEDLDLLFRLEARGLLCAPIPEVLIDIHIHAGTSLSRNKDFHRFTDSYRTLVKKNHPLLERYPLLWLHYHDSLAGHLYRVGAHGEARRLIWQIFRRNPLRLAGVGKFLRFEWKRLRQQTPQG